MGLKVHLCLAPEQRVVFSILLFERVQSQGFCPSVCESVVMLIEIEYACSGGCVIFNQLSSLCFEEILMPHAALWHSVDCFCVEASILSYLLQIIPVQF